MDTRKIEAFAKVYEFCSFSKAGKSLYLSQPTISAHVAALEQELNVILFDRIGRSVVPTKAGEILYLHARKIFEASELARTEIQKLQDRITGCLDIGGSTIPANYFLPDMLARFWNLYSEVSMDLRVGDSEEILDLVRDNSLMLGVVGFAPDHPDLSYEVLARDNMVLVMSPDLYAKYKHLDGADFLSAIPWVMREEGSGTRYAMSKALERMNLDVSRMRQVIRVRNSGAMARCIQAGMGAGITSKVTVSDALERNQLCAVALDGLQVERNFYIVYNKKRSLFPAAIKLIEFLKNDAARICITGNTP